jgi:hypothetical protein
MNLRDVGLGGGGAWTGSTRFKIGAGGALL